MCLRIHVAYACVTVYWASQLILSFQVLIVFLMMTAIWMTTATISWVTVQISRSVQTSSTISCETPIYIILYVLRDVRTSFCTIFRGSNTFFYIVLIILFDILLGACVCMIIFYDRTYFIGFYVYELFACRSSILKMVSNFLLSTAIKCLSKPIIELSVIKNE